MEQEKVKTRDIRFRREKNQKMVSVHSKEAREYARHLENTRAVKIYEVSKVLDNSILKTVEPVGIRSPYFAQDWTSDFFITYTDGCVAVREVIQPQMLQRRSLVERLELSRRYWALVGIEDWKIVMVRTASKCF